jgi:5-methylthioribose kinase
MVTTFPGSWLKAADGLRVIDPEFCFLGDPEFDCGILAAHLMIAQCGPAFSSSSWPP